MPNRDATYNKIIAAFPDGGTYTIGANTYTLSVQDDGISSKFVEVYYDSSKELTFSNHVLRHRTRYTTSPQASNNCPETLEKATLQKDWERVDYQRTQSRFIPVWFNEEAGEDLSTGQSVSDIMAGKFPDHPAIKQLLVDHPNFNFENNQIYSKFTRCRYRVKFLDATGTPVYEMSLDQVPDAGSENPIVDIDLKIIKGNKDANDVMELFTIAAQLDDDFDLFSRGNIESIRDDLDIGVVAGQIAVPAGNVDALKDAIDLANEAYINHATGIHLEGGTYTLKGVDNDTDGPNGLPSIKRSIGITSCDDADPIIERDASQSTPPFRIFHISEAEGSGGDFNGSLSLTGITVRNGSTPHDGGGIFNRGQLFVRDGTITNNTALRGGGIANEGKRINESARAEIATLINCTIGSNTATISDPTDGGGGIRNDEGTELRLENCVVSGNRAEGGDGGGMLIKQKEIDNGGILEPRSVRVDGSSIVNNFCGNDGGGMSIRVGTVTVSNSTFYNNIAKQDAGGMDVEVGSFVKLINCTIGSNTAGIDSGGINNEGDVKLTSCTVGSNTAATDDGGGIKNNSGKVTLQNTIIANNHAPHNGPGYDGRNGIVGNINNNISQGNNLISNSADSRISFIETGDRKDKKNLAPRLSSYLDDGKPGHGHYPLDKDSPAIDAGADVLLRDPLLRADQLGRGRQVDGNGDGTAGVDIGAIELGAIDPPVVNDFVSELKGQRVTSYNPDPVPNGPAGTLTIKAIFSIKDGFPSIYRPFFKVVELSGGNLLLNADGGADGVGATLTPDAGDDGVLSDPFSVDFVIGLQERQKFIFSVDLLASLF